MHRKMTRLALGLPMSLAPAGKLAGQTLGLAWALAESMLVRAVAPIPTVAWLRKLRRLMKVVGSMVLSVRYR